MSARTALGAEVQGLLHRAATLYRDRPHVAGRLREHLDRFDEPLRLAVAGKVKAGKSTLLNALLGEEIAATDAGECTQVVTWYRDGPAPRVTLFPRGAPPRTVPMRRAGPSGAVDLRGVPPEELDRAVVDWPSRRLRVMSLIDTPGLASPSGATSARAGAFLTPDDGPAPVDAVLYLMRHRHSSDTRFLESFHDQGLARGSPVNTVAVLCRADEIGVGRPDAMSSARTIAGRYRADAKVSRLCQTVVPVCGLLALRAGTLRPQEFHALRELSRLPVEDVEEALLSVDRFVHPPESVASLLPSTLSPEDRGELLDRFGMFGLRFAVASLRDGVDDPDRLRAELARHSGLDELREVIDVQFGGRRELLKARSGLLAVDGVLRREPLPQAAALADDLERIAGHAHELVELRLLPALRSKALTLPEDGQAEAERLLGGRGASRSERLGLEPEAGAAQQRAALLDALRRWQQRAESPLSERAAVDVARVVIRSCEGMLVTLPP